MTTDDPEGGSRSTWMRRPRPSYGTPLPDHPVVEVCVIGAGIAGLSVAYELTRRGTPVMVIDQARPGAGETGDTTAHLSCALDDHFYSLERTCGGDAAKQAAASHRAAIDRIEEIVGTLEARCDFARVDGYLIACAGRSVDELARERDAALRAGVPCEMVDAAPMPWPTGPALRFPRQARFEPLAYLDALAEAVVAQGGTIHPGVHVTGIRRSANGAVDLELDGDRSIEAAAVVDATNTAISSMVRMQLRQAAYRTYVISAEVNGSEIPDVLLWDTGDPYHYVRRARHAEARDLFE
jgi:glycine/D-amino acid oxidase-like deaminating enzyme